MSEVDDYLEGLDEPNRAALDRARRARRDGADDVLRDIISLRLAEIT